MPTQPEQVLEDNLVAQLVSLGYGKVVIGDERDLPANLKAQLEKHNQMTLSAKEFDKVTNHLNKGNVFDRLKTRNSLFSISLNIRRKSFFDLKYFTFLRLIGERCLLIINF